MRAVFNDGRDEYNLLVCESHGFDSVKPTHLQARLE